MIIDRTHKKWAAASGLVMAAAAGAYCNYAAKAPNGPSGRSFEGLCFGVVGFLMILFAAALAFRRKLPHWQIGSGQVWLKAHIWIGLLSFPIILLHAGFRIGGPMATLLMVIFAIVYVSGILGLLLQHLLPERMMLQVGRETIYSQIDHVLAGIRKEALDIVEQAAGTLPPSLDTVKVGAAAGQSVVRAGSEPLVIFYRDLVKPYLEGTPNELTDARTRTAYFDQVRARVPAGLQVSLDQLGNLCEERRQMDTQKNLHHWLHGWLLVHMPLSILLVALMIVHAIQALKY